MKDWKIGYAECDITPQPGQTLMAGFAQERYARGALAPLRAQALALQDSHGKPAVLLTADVLGFDPCFVTAVRRAIERQHRLPAEAVMLAASHTHWGPAVSYRVGFAASGQDVWYRKRFEESILACVAEALGSLTSGKIGYTALDTRIGHNRRLPDGKGGIAWAPYADGSYDTYTPVLRIERRGTPSQIVLVGHACHPTSSGSVAKWTPDYPGAMRDRLEQALPPKSRAMFVMGCGGDAKVCHWDRKTDRPVFSASPARSRAAGRKLAEAVLKQLQSQPVKLLSGSLGCRLAHGSLNFARPRNRRQIEAMAFDGQTSFWESSWARQSLAYPDLRRALHYEVQAWRLGEQLTILGLEGEVCSPLGPLARALARTPEAMTIAYANVTEAYIPTRKIVREGGYEGESSHRAYFLPAPFTVGVEQEFRKIVTKAVG